MPELVPCCDAHAEYVAKLRKIELNIKILKDEIAKLRSSWKYHHKIIELNGWEFVPPEPVTNNEETVHE